MKHKNPFLIIVFCLFFLVFLINISSATSIDIDWIYPTSNINVEEGYFFNITTNISCSGEDCGEINVTLDPESTVYNFTTCGSTGRNGPSQSDCNTNYTGTSLEDLVSVSAGIQNWTVPSTGTYTITAVGAAGVQGGSTSGQGGLGAYIRGDFELTAGTVIQILVGQKGVRDGTYAGGGGGGTFVIDYTNDDPLIIAGGGGGASIRSSTYTAGRNATTNTSGRYGSLDSTLNYNSAGNSGGGGITSTNGGGAGGGYIGDGADYNTGSGGHSFKNLGVGGAGTGASYGGFGGGGQGYGGGGGGGGYNGGGAGAYGGNGGGGGGGGSVNNGTNQNNTEGLGTDLGYVTIELTSEEKSGTVSMTEGTTPFYTNVTNPYNLTLNSGESQIITWWVNATGSVNTAHTFFIYSNLTSNESIGNMTSKLNITIVDTVNPEINLVYPENTTYSTSLSEINYTYSDKNPGSCWHSINSGLTNSSSQNAGTNLTGLDSSDGSNTWFVYCNDTSGNLASDSVTFVEKLPQISLTRLAPTTDINVTQNQFFEVQTRVTCSNNDCGEINVTLDPIQGNGLNYTIYNDSEVLGDDFEWNEIIGNGGDALWDGTTADDSYKTAALPFNFSFYGTNYTTIYVSSNGRIHFTTTSASSTSLALPSSSYKLISPVNRDMYVRSTTKVYVKNATDPDRTIIQYQDLDYYSGGPVKFTYQLILHKDGKINILYNNSNSAYASSSSSQEIGLNQNTSDYAFLGSDAPDQYKGMAITFLPPGYSTTSTKGGTVSMTVGTTPFYTNVTNPYNLTLNEGESQTISWWVNATGTLNENYTFFVYANKTSDFSIGDITSNWTVTILENGTYSEGSDNTAPTIAFLYPLDNTNYLSDVTHINFTSTDTTAVGSC